ncbi:MAG: hypothetical protein GF411_11055 [Candidatus Lokiarchaeota archaeon]|nr:hypothetical protein [Candidatus Lokiarchaeota archaeon]
MGKLYILDTGAFLSTWTQKQIDAEFISTPSVYDELKNRTSRNRADTLISLDKLSLISGNPQVIKKVRDAASEFGDRVVLSDTDIELIAVALIYNQERESVMLVSTDLAVLNTAASLSIKIIDPKKRMRKTILWIYRCEACGRTEHRPPANLECPVCGTIMHRKSKASSKVRK